MLKKYTVFGNSQEARIDMKTKLNCFFDTNVYDFLLLNDIDLEKIKCHLKVHSSNIQYSEIQNIKNEHKKEALITLYKDINPDKLLIRSGVWLDSLYWDDDQPWIDEVGEIANSLIGNSTGKIPWEDALIGEIASLNDMVLITNDIRFRKKALSFGIKSLTVNELLIHIDTK